jgi:glycine oxidase
LLLLLLQRSDGRVLIGATQPAPASNTDTSDANAARILAAAAAAVPALSQAAVEGMHVGHRPYPADGYPVLGWAPGCSNVYVAGE